MSKTQTIQTQYGDVDVETVNCDSCGNELPKEEASRFIVGDIHDISTFSTLPDKYQFKNESLGWVCPYCEGDPAAYPTGRAFRWLASTKALVTASLLAATVWMLL